MTSLNNFASGETNVFMLLFSGLKLCGFIKANFKCGYCPAFLTNKFAKILCCGSGPEIKNK